MMKWYLVLIPALCLFATYHSTAQVNQIDGNFIKDWLILGSFSGRNIDQDYLKNVDGEANMNPKVGDTIKTAQGGTLTWSLYRSRILSIFSLSTANGLGDNQVTDIYQANDGIMWFGTYRSYIHIAGKRWGVD